MSLNCKHTLHLCLAFISPAIIWSLLQYQMGVECPVVILESGALAPSHHRGDVLILKKKPTYKLGDLIVFNVERAPRPVVHRVISLVVDADGSTLGNMRRLNDSQVIGGVEGYLSLIGVPILLLSDSTCLQTLCWSALCWLSYNYIFSSAVTVQEEGIVG
uniref:Signal peptidase complex catalytic subunit SEC11 n=1 Tax=Palpitomonas bilix TaxID=652834 RepID=A0A7S3G154_9EUKA|mmetsp:Transcript_16867/g.42341  ORF Transcript_16867/g.42341 Transcript_16867/m.42341 type:complete len:160 (+) Transcript_16867:302-781(+)